jgi:hypothetical protein
MPDDPTPPKAEPPPADSPKRGRPAAPTGTDARAERLAAQLRANLKRRKEQARGRAATDKADDPS